MIQNEKIISIFFWLFWGVFLYFVVYSIWVFCSYFHFYFKIKRHQKHLLFQNRLSHEYFVPISIIVATYNEVNGLVSSIESLCHLNYKLYEIIIVDDGSTDQTISKLVHQFHLKKIERPIRKILKSKEVVEIYESSSLPIKIMLLKKEHGGMADAYHAGINISTYPYVTCLKVNQRLSKDSLSNLARPILENEHIVMCSGVTQIGYQDEEEALYFRTFYEWLQLFYYERKSITNIEQLGMPTFHLFQKSLVMKVRGFDKGSIGENFELARKIETYMIQKGEKIAKRNVYDAICFWKVPSTMNGFIRQEKKYRLGFVRCFKKHKKISNSKFKNLVFSIYYYLYERFMPIFFLCSVLIGIFGLIYHLFSWPIFFSFLGSYFFLLAVLSFFTFLTQVKSLGISLQVSTLVAGFIFCFIEVICMPWVMLLRFCFPFFFHEKKKVSSV